MEFFIPIFEDDQQKMKHFLHIAPQCAQRFPR